VREERQAAHRCTHRSLQLFQSAPAIRPGTIGPEHAFLRDCERAEYRQASDAEALEGLQLCAKLEGIIPALETAHAILPAIRVARELPPYDAIIVNVSGRGDKDVQQVAELQGQ